MERISGLALLGHIHVKFFEECTGRNFAPAAQNEVQGLLRKDTFDTDLLTDLPAPSMRLLPPKHVSPTAYPFIGVVLVLERVADDLLFKQQRASVFKAFGFKNSHRGSVSWWPFALRNWMCSICGLRWRRHKCHASV